MATIDKGIIVDYLESAYNQTRDEMLDVSFIPKNEKRKAYEMGRHDAIGEILADVKNMGEFDPNDVINDAFKKCMEQIDSDHGIYKLSESVVKEMSERMEQLFINEFNKANKKIEELEKQNKLLEIENNRLKVEIDLLTKGKTLNEIKKEIR